MYQVGTSPPSSAENNDLDSQTRIDPDAAQFGGHSSPGGPIRQGNNTASSSSTSPGTVEVPQTPCGDIDLNSSAAPDRLETTLSLPLLNYSDSFLTEADWSGLYTPECFEPFKTREPPQPFLRPSNVWQQDGEIDVTNYQQLPIGSVPNPESQTTPPRHEMYEMMRWVVQTLQSGDRTEACEKAVAERDDWKTKHDDEKRDKDLWKTRCETLQTKCDNLVTDKDGWKTRCETLQTKCDNLETDRDGWKTRCETLQTKCDNLETDRDGWKTKHDVEKSDKDLWKTRCETEQAEKKQIVKNVKGARRIFDIIGENTAGWGDIQADENAVLKGLISQC
jgi:hypothetical protein